MAGIDPHDGDNGAEPEMSARRQVAVALRYDPGATDEPPRVVASGRGAVAEQILQLAFAHGVRVRSDPNLAEILAAIDIDSVIPLEAFVAVAEILAYVYRLNGQSVPPLAGPGPQAATPSAVAAGGAGPD